MADVDRQHFPKLEQAQELLVEFIIDHPNMIELAAALGPFFRWMAKYDKTDGPEVD